MSPIPRHVSWANREPHHRGHFGFNYSTSSDNWYDVSSDEIKSGNITIPASGTISVGIPSGNVALIYRVKVESSQSEDFSISFYEKSRRNSEDFIFNLSTQLELENGYYIFQGKNLIVCVDKDNSEYIHAVITGEPSDILSIDMNLVRLP